ncbi:MAG: DUF3179 domain-containing (seleno)protein [Pirellulaceae bacterium]
MTGKRLFAIAIAGLLAFGAYWLISARDESAKLYAEAVQRAMEREVEKLASLSTSASAKQQAPKAVDPKAALGSMEESSEAVSFRPAIPEFPNISWDETRAWNLPLNNPPTELAARAIMMDPDEPVIGVLLGRRARAYPWAVLANYHVINDQIGSKHVIINLCEACNGGSAFLASTKAATIDFRPCGLKNGTWYAIDFQTGSLWYPFSGKAFEGPLKGTKLTRIRTYFSTWRQWMRDHPETTVVQSNDEVRNRDHGRTSHMADNGTISPEIMERLAKPEPNPKIDLLPQYELVFGLIPGDNDDTPPVAFSIDKLRNSDGLVQLSIGSTPVVVFVRNDYQVGAYIRTVDKEEVDLKLVSQEPFVMQDQHGNKWDEWGRQVSGETFQAELPVADGYLTKWYEWLENFPTTNLKTPADYATADVE